MSPEQARGQAVDKRTDIWAFGCVLYEMLAGRPAFDGGTVSDTLVSVLEREPDWSALPADDARRPFARCFGAACARIRRRGCTISPTRASRSTSGSDRTAGSGETPRAAVARMDPRRCVGRDLGAGRDRLSSSFAARSRRRSAFEFPVAPPEHATFPSRYGGFAVSPDGRHSWSPHRLTGDRASGSGPSPRQTIGRFPGRMARCSRSGNQMAARLASSPAAGSRSSPCGAASR